MGSDPICWSSKKQSTVATSTMEAEYIGTTECTKNVLWISVTKVSTGTGLKILCDFVVELYINDN